MYMFMYMYMYMYMYIYMFICSMCVDTVGVGWRGQRGSVADHPCTRYEGLYMYMMHMNIMCILYISAKRWHRRSPLYQVSASNFLLHISIFIMYIPTVSIVHTHNIHNIHTIYT
jgi:hypothetical protein